MFNRMAVLSLTSQRREAKNVYWLKASCKPVQAFKQISFSQQKQKCRHFCWISCFQLKHRCYLCALLLLIINTIHYQQFTNTNKIIPSEIPSGYPGIWTRTGSGTERGCEGWGRKRGSWEYMGREGEGKRREWRRKDGRKLRREGGRMIEMERMWKKWRVSYRRFNKNLW